MNNLHFNIQRARDAVSYGVSDEPIEFKEGHYYMGSGENPLVIYIDEANAEEDYYTIYVLNLWTTYYGKMHNMFSGGNIKGQAKPWFNIYRVPLRKLNSNYKIDITKWINPLRRVSFMNWNQIPWEVNK